MAAQDSQDKTLPASERKLTKAREDGQVARSRDLSHFAVVAGGGALLVATAPLALGWMRELLASALRFDAGVLQGTAAMGQQLGTLTTKWMLGVVPFGLLTAGVAVLGSIALGGWNWT